jgi:hypothetical protein
VFVDAREGNVRVMIARTAVTEPVTIARPMRRWMRLRLSAKAVAPRSWPSSQISDNAIPASVIEAVAARWSVKMPGGRPGVTH